MLNIAKPEKKKKSFKMPHMMVLLIGLLVFMSIMTYVIPAGQFAKDPETGKLLSDQFSFLASNTPVNPWEAMKLILTGLQNSGLIIGLLLVAGGYTGVILSTKAIDETVDWAIYKLKNKGVNVLVPIVFYIYCFIGAFAGGDHIIAMVPIGLMFAKKLKLDPIVGMSVIILAYFTGGLSSPTGCMLPQLTMGVQLYSGFGVRFVIFLILSTVSMLFILRYAKRVAKDPSNSVLPMEDWYDDCIENTDDSTIKEIVLSKTSAIIVVLFLLQPVISLILVSVFKQGYGSIAAVMIIMAFIIGKIKKLPFEDISNRFAKGCGSMAFVCFIIGCAATLSLIMNQGNILHTIIYYACMPLKNLGVGMATIGMSFVITIINIFIPSASAKVAVLCPIIQPMCETLNIPLQVGVQAFLNGDKLTNILSPFLGITIGSLALSKIDYAKYAKWVLPCLIILAILCFSSLYILATLGWS